MYRLIIGQLLVGSYPPDFRNLSSHRWTKSHYHIKVADHGGGSFGKFCSNIWWVWKDWL